jgi:hypothetical protein
VCRCSGGERAGGVDDGLHTVRGGGLDVGAYCVALFGGGAVTTARSLSWSLPVAAPASPRWSRASGGADAAAGR